MLISIVIPTFNHGRFLGRALDSIMSQAHRPIEVIVVDGASTDDTVNVLSDYADRYPEIRWVSEKDDGPADAVNKGLAMVTGDVIGICSADDLYYPGAFATVSAVAASHPDHGFFYGDIEGVDLEGRVLGNSNMPPFSWEWVFARALTLPQGSIFFRTEVARAAGGWNGDYYGCDLDYWLRLLLRTPALKVDATLSAWTHYAEQRTRPDRFATIWSDYWRMIKQSPDLAAAPRRLRRMAFASRHLLAFRIHPTSNVWALRWHALAALPGHPTYWRYGHKDSLRELIPGYRAVRAVYRAATRLRARPA